MFLLFLSLFVYMGRSQFPLCDQGGALCVQLNTSCSCPNCDGLSIQGVVDTVENNGNTVIYLVGCWSTLVEHSENVWLQKTSQPDITKTHSILVYPGHRVRWKNFGNNNVLTVTKHWWRISGYGGYLEITNDGNQSPDKRLVKMGGAGVFFDNVHFHNRNPRIESMFQISVPYRDLYGVSVKDCVFEGNDHCDSTMTIDAPCNGYCTDEDFTNTYGESHRIWIKNNTFKANSTYHIQMEYPSYVIEGNYFHKYPPLSIKSKYQDGLSIFNNIFHIDGLDVDHIIRLYYEKEGTNAILRRNRFYNNLIIDDQGSLNQLILSQGLSGDDCIHPPDRYFVYNNMIVASQCISVVECQNSCSTNIHYRSNRITNSSCVKESFKGGTTCNDTLSILEDSGFNTAGDVSFYGSGDIPYPFYELEKDVVGLRFENQSGMYVLPTEDILGRPREGPHNRTSVGAYEYQGVYPTYPDCDLGGSTFCVEASREFPCGNCHFLSLQEALDGIEDTLGGYTFFLVGNGSSVSKVDMYECVSINSMIVSPESIASTSTIKPYPGHSIRWGPSGDCHTVSFENSLWWNIDGSGGTLELTNEKYSSSSVNKRIVYAENSGVFLQNLKITNYIFNTDTLLFFKGEESNFHGFVFRFNHITGENVFNFVLFTDAHCDGLCPQNSFVDTYGEERRIWVYKNRFSVKNTKWDIRGDPLVFTIEENLFESKSSSSALISYMSTPGVETLHVLNNVFYNQSLPFHFYFRAEKTLNIHGKLRIYNNHFIDPENQITHMLKFEPMFGQENKLSSPIHFYNNLIVAPEFVNFVFCISDDTLAHVYFRNNHQTASINGWDATPKNCNMSISVVENLGQNTIGPVNFIGSGSEPFPYYDLNTDLVGMVFTNPRNTSFYYPWTLPTLDREGRPRPGPKGDKAGPNRTTIGAFEYQNLYPMYENCDFPKVKCVEVNSKYPCGNCDSTSLQTVVDGIGGFGEFKIYLVGSNAVEGVNMSECVTISQNTPEEVEKVNTIQPYPGHSIRWEPSSRDCRNLYLDNVYYWKITGEGGKLEITNFWDTSTSVQIIYSVSSSFFLEDLHITNNRYQLDTVIEPRATGVAFRGVSIKRNIFRGKYTMYLIKTFFNCDGCQSTSYTNTFGEERRMWISHNTFEMDRVFFGDIFGIPLSFTIEGNYFHDAGGLYSLNEMPNSGRDTLLIYNNVFHYGSTANHGHVFNFKYEKEGDQPNRGKRRFFNNLIVAESASLSKIIVFEATFSGWYSHSEPLYVYNNLIEGKAANMKLFECYDTKSSANIRFQNNVYNREDFIFVPQICNVSNNIIENLGGNEQSSIEFVSKESNNYDLKKDVIGMTMTYPRNTSQWYTWILPETDYKNRSRPGSSGLLNRTSVGPYEFSGTYQVYDLCDSSDKVICIEVSKYHPCGNCRFRSVQEAVDSVDDSGGYTFYLVGNESVSRVNFDETVYVYLNPNTPENISLANTIQPYPGHSIRWNFRSGSGNSATIFFNNVRWWRISGEGGYLEVTNEGTSDVNIPIIRVEDGGLFVENLVLVNLISGSSEMVVVGAVGIAFHGVVIKNNKFVGQEVVKVLRLSCSCDGNCVDNAYTDTYGVEKRIWIAGNTFSLTEVTVADIYGMPLSHTIEGNFFNDSLTVRTFYDNIDESMETLLIYNNVIRHPVGSDPTHVIIEYYRMSGIFDVYGKRRFFNNLIVDDSGNMESILYYYRKAADASPPDEFYFYNNLIVSPVDVDFVHCDFTGLSVANVVYQYNYQTSTTNVWNTAFNCAINSVMENLGNNYFGAVVDFEEIGDLPSPFYDLASDIIGMTFTEDSYNTSAMNPFPLPSHDYDGRPRPGSSGSLQRSSVGAYEYQDSYPYYPLCDEPRTFCVEVDVVFNPCLNCLFSKLQDVVDLAEMSQGDNTIYLFGKEGVVVNMTESVIISQSTSENVSARNIIKPYPGHIIHWYPSTDDLPNLQITVTGFWWEITSGDSELMFLNLETTNVNARVITLYTKGVILRNFTIQNRVTDLKVVIQVHQPLAPLFFHGVMIDEITFTGISVEKTIVSYYYCDGGCSPSSFTEMYGEERRIWIKNNDFTNPASSCHIHGLPLSYTIEGNVFRSSFSSDAIRFNWENAQDGASIFNNIFMITSGDVWTYVFRMIYKSIGEFTSHGKIQIYNNLVDVEGGGSLESIFGFLRSDGAQLNYSDPIYFYNNLFEQSEMASCLSLAMCYNDDSVVHVVSQYNRISKESCKFDDLIEHMNSSCSPIRTSLLVDGGRNEFESIRFVGGGASKPFPYYDLLVDAPGMKNPSSSSLALPETDFLGRARAGPVLSSMGAFQFQCPQACLGGSGDSLRVDCQEKENCSCLTPHHFGTYSCQFTFDDQLCPSCEKGECDTNATNGNYYCVCQDEDYSGFLCNLTQCFGVDNSDASNVCSGRGNCEIHDVCDCSENYYGEVCNITTCYEVLSNLSLSCGDHGTCLEHERCFCDDFYYGKYCNFSSCFGFLANYTESVCDGHGDCMDHDICKCSMFYFGMNCNITTCFGYFSNDSERSYCSSHGQCVKHDTCSCDDDYYGDTCNISTCFDVFSNYTSEVCSLGRGECIDFNNCSCFLNASGDEMYFGEECQHHYCFGIPSDEHSDVCFGHGVCNDTDSCICHGNYTHPVDDDEHKKEDCSSWFCFGYRFDDVDDDNVCSGFGNCTSPDYCECDSDDYSSSDCGVWQCYNKYRDDDFVCGQHGICESHDSCFCTSSEYAGDMCDEFTCYNISSKVEEACGPFGICLDIDFCGCYQGYYSATPTSEDACQSWNCFGQHKDFSSVCTKRGKCRSPDLCSCTDNFDGDACESWSCGLDYKSPASCNGPDKCKCKSGYSGILCQTNDMYLTVMTPILGTFGVIVFLVVMLLLCCFLCALCLCVLLMVLGIFVIIGFSLIVLVQKLRMKKFEKLRNVDILLEEQKLEEDSSVAHIHMNKKLFEIDYNEIKINKVLGEGGSASVVYKATWKNNVVAFKCFKTRTICSSQDNFDEFEKEVQVFSSISHPNVVTFFGCTMKPPRVGILMEFCENGECFEYIKKYEKENEESRYPLKERIRMLSEVISACDYLHSRNIIHRDLKCENVLLDGGERCKLMDFGLSKISERLSKQKTKRVGTSFYMAPEVTSGSETYNEKCDVFSFAIMVWVLITGDDQPYGHVSDFNIELRVANNPNFRPSMKIMKKYLVPYKKYRWIVGLTEKCWKHDHSERPSFEELSNIYSAKLMELNEGKDDDDNNEEEMSSSSEEEEQKMIVSGKVDDDKRKIVTLEKVIREKDKRIRELEKLVKSLQKE